MQDIYGLLHSRGFGKTRIIPNVSFLENRNTEDLERSDAMEYTRRMNSIRNRVEEFVLHDFVYA